MGRVGWVTSLSVLVASATAVAVSLDEPASAVGGFTELQRGQVAGESEVELIMGLVERTGQSTSGKHYHPGGEFGFVLEGTATIISENGPPLTVEAGSSFYQPPGEWHIVKTGAGDTKALVFRAVRKGDPVIVEVE